MSDSLRLRAQALRMHGLLAHWSEVIDTPWLAPLLQWEEDERARKSLERRLQAAHLGRFKPLCDFDQKVCEVDSINMPLNMPTRRFHK